MPRRHRRLCSREDPARLRGTGCTLASPTGCGIVYALFRMSNGKLLVPGERGLVGASASAEAGAAPLEAAAWRLIEVEGSWSRGGWVQLRHVLSGAFLRLVPPPHPLQWTFSVDGQPASHASLFQLECDKPPCDGSAPVHLRVHPDATGARLNYRGDGPRALALSRSRSLALSLSRSLALALSPALSLSLSPSLPLSLSPSLPLSLSPSLPLPPSLPPSLSAGAPLPL